MQFDAFGELKIFLFIALNLGLTTILLELQSQTLNSEHSKYSYNSNNIGYWLICDTCKGRNINKVYEGETSRTARLRSKEHLSFFFYKNENNVMFQHKEIDHKNEEIEFSMKITNTFKEPLSRQANEAVRIKNREQKETLNSKSEFNHPPIARITVDGKKTFFSNRKNENQPSYELDRCGTALFNPQLGVAKVNMNIS